MRNLREQYLSLVTPNGSKPLEVTACAQNALAKVILAYVASTLGKAPTVNLMGACAPTTYRDDAMIPMLSGWGLAYFDPYVKDWDPAKADDYVRAETEAIHSGTVTHMMIAAADELMHTRGLVSLIEAYHLILTGKPIILVLADLPPGAEIKGQCVSTLEAQLINSLRQELREVAKTFGIPVFNTVAESKLHILPALLSPERYRADADEIADYIRSKGLQAGGDLVQRVVLSSDPITAIAELLTTFVRQFLVPRELQIHLPDLDAWQGSVLADGTPINGRLLDDLRRFFMPSAVRHLGALERVNIYDHTDKLIVI